MVGNDRDPLASRIAAAIGGRRPEDELYFNKVAFVTRIVLSAISPGPPIAEQQRHQRKLLDRCLYGAPAGRVLGREVLTGTFRTLTPNGDNGDNGDDVDVEVVHTRSEILHVGFERKPFWMENSHG